MLREKYFNLCRKVWLKFRISLPLWRKLWKEYTIRLQADLSWQHRIRNAVNDVYHTDCTTLQAYLTMDAHKKSLPDKFPLITPESRSYIRK